MGLMFDGAVKGVSKKQLLEENRALKTALEKSQAENALLRQKVDLLDPKSLWGQQ